MKKAKATGTKKPAAKTKKRGSAGDNALTPADEKALDKAWDSVSGGKGRTGGGKIAGKKKK